MSVSRLVTTLQQRCTQSGDWSSVAELIQKYEARIEKLERDNCERITAVMEADALRNLLVDERTRNGDAKKQLETFQFRMAYDMMCKLTEDDVPDNSGFTVDQQANVIMQSFNLGEIPARPVDTDGMDSRAEAVLALHTQMNTLRTTAKQLRQVLQSQVEERLHIKRALDKAQAFESEVSSQLDTARRALEKERDSREKIVLQLKTEVNEAKERAASLEKRLFTELDALRRSAREREEKLEQSNQKLAEELERLRTVERRLLRSESELEGARKTAADLRAAYNTEVKKVAEAGNSVRVGILKELTKCAAQFDSLPLAMKISSLTRQPSASSQIPAAEMLTSAAAAEALSEDIKEHFLALNATVTYISKLLEEKSDAEIQQKIDDERSRLAEIATLRTKVNALLFRLDPADLGENVGDAVEEYAKLEKRMKRVRNSVRRSITASPTIASAMEEVEDDLDDAEQAELDALLQENPQLKSLLLDASDNQQRDYDNDTGPDGGALTPLERRVVPELQSMLSERQMELLLKVAAKRSSSVAFVDAGGPNGENASALEASVLSSSLAGHVSSFSSPSSPQSVANLLQALRDHQARKQSIASNGMGDSSIASGGSMSNNGLVLPPLRAIADETKQSNSKLFASVAKLGGELCVARSSSVSSFLKTVDDQRLVNLKTCLAVLENAQKEYAKSKGIRLPPLDDLPQINPDSEIGRPVAVTRCGGLITGKLWRDERTAKAAAAAVKSRKSKPKLSLSSSPPPMQRRK